MRGEADVHARVLIIEDDEGNRESLADLLDALGYLVDCAANGREALEHLRRGLLPNLILLDLTMPVMDGFEFRRQQLGDDRVSAIPVVVLSAVESDAAQRAELHADVYLQKPVPVDLLMEALERLCAGSSTSWRMG